MHVSGKNKCAAAQCILVSSGAKERSALLERPPHPAPAEKTKRKNKHDKINTKGVVSVFTGTRASLAMVSATTRGRGRLAECESGRAHGRTGCSGILSAVQRQ